MAHPSVQLVNALRETAHRLENGAVYAWGNHGSCNCGNLLQVVTQLSRQQILSYAHSGIGEWTELAEESCPVSNAPVSLLIATLENLGLTPTDIHNLEYLEDKEVLKSLPGGFRWLKKNLREDVIVYFETFADMLEAKLPPIQIKAKASSSVIISKKAIESTSKSLTLVAEETW